MHITKQRRFALVEREVRANGRGGLLLLVLLRAGDGANKNGSIREIKRERERGNGETLWKSGALIILASLMTATRAKANIRRSSGAGAKASFPPGIYFLCASVFLSVSSAQALSLQTALKSGAVF